MKERYSRSSEGRRRGATAPSRDGPVVPRPDLAIDAAGIQTATAQSCCYHVTVYQRSLLRNHFDLGGLHHLQLRPSFATRPSFPLSLREALDTHRSLSKRIGTTSMIERLVEKNGGSLLKLHQPELDGPGCSEPLPLRGYFATNNPTRSPDLSSNTPVTSDYSSDSPRPCVLNWGVIDRLVPSTMLLDGSLPEHFSGDEPVNLVFEL